MPSNKKKQKQIPAAIHFEIGIHTSKPSALIVELKNVCKKYAIDKNKYSLSFK